MRRMLTWAVYLPGWGFPWVRETIGYAGEGIRKKICLLASGKGAYKMGRKSGRGIVLLWAAGQSVHCKNISCGWIPAGKMLFWGEFWSGF